MVRRRDPQPEKLVTVDRYDNAHEAEVARVLLQTAGIWSHLDNLHTNSFAGLGGTIGLIRLMVAETDAEDALRLIEIHQAARKQRQSKQVYVTAEIDDHVCLSCGEPMLDEEDRCPECGWSWLDEEDDVV